MLNLSIVQVKTTVMAITV